VKIVLPSILINLFELVYLFCNKWLTDNKFLFFADRHVCQADNQEGTSYSDSKQCTFKRLGSIRLTQNDEVSNACLAPRIRKKLLQKEKKRNAAIFLILQSKFDMFHNINKRPENMCSGSA